MQVALDYADKNPGTLVVSVADHETGGMRLDIGGERTPAVFRSYETTAAEMALEALEAVAALGFSLSPRSIIGAVQETISDLTGGSVRLRTKEILSVLDASSIEDAIFDLSLLLNARGGVQYTTTGHTEADVSLFAFGPGADLLEGSVDNTDVGRWLAETMGLSFLVKQDTAYADLTNEDLWSASETWMDRMM